MKHYKPSGGKAKKRLLALVLAMALIVGCLLPVYANGVATMDTGFGMDSGFGVDVQLDDDFGVDIQDEDEGADLDLAPGVTERVDANGNIVYEWGESTWNQWDNEQVSPYPDGEQMDPGFAIPTNTYRFWLTNDETKRAAADVEIASAMELYDMTAYDATEMYGPLYGMYTLVAIADGGTMSDNTVLNPTSADAPDASKPYFAGWYTVDEFGYEQEFLFDHSTVSVAKSATVDVFAKWTAAKSGEAAQPNEDLAAEQTYERWFAQLISCSDSAFNDLIDRYLEDEGFEAWLNNLPDDEIQYLSDRMDATAEMIPNGENRPVEIAPGDSQTIDIFESWSSSKITNVTYTCLQKNITAKATNNQKGYTITVESDVPEGTYIMTVTYTYTYYSWNLQQKSDKVTDTITVKVKKAQESSEEKYYAQEHYDPDEYVAWDVVGSYDKDGIPSGGMDNGSNYIASVTMNLKDVLQGESDHVYPRYNKEKDMPEDPDRVGKKQSTYFGSDVSGSTDSKSVTLSITPQQGYYVSGFWIVCCGGTNSWVGTTPYNCAVLQDGNEYRATFEFADSLGGTVNATVSSAYFGHPAPTVDDQNFILISVAKIPTPLFVEYDYGDIVTYGAAEDIFTDPTKWTNTTAGNVYGTNGKVDTADTQYRYSYDSNKPEESTDWKHYANTVTQAAKEAAANAGYYFAGWKAEYYSEAGESQKNTSNGNKYNYNFSNQYSADRTYAEGNEVALLMHVKLVAQWEPIQLKVMKKVEGLESGFTGKYDLRVDKLTAPDQWTEITTIEFIFNADGEQASIIAADSTETATAIAIIPGTYRVVETNANETIMGSTTNAYCTTTYPTGTVVVEANGTVKELIVLNSYSSQPATSTVTITKNVTGIFGERSTDFNFEVTFDCDAANITAEHGNSKKTVEKDSDGKFTFTLKHDETITFSNVPIDAQITVTETNTNDYEVSATVDGGEKIEASTITHKVLAPDSNGDAQNNIVVTNHKAGLVDAGIDLGSATPYLFLLCVGAVGVATLRRKRER